MDHRYIFIGGLHRSGTSLFRDLLTEHPQVSGFVRAGVIQNEGQFLQDVYPRDRKLGGPGRFALNPGAHLTEDSPLVSDGNRQRLADSWAPYWDLSLPLLVEKTPSNMVRTRFLQALFPFSTFIILVRHPVATTLATMKWHKTGIPTLQLLDHWFVAHDLLRMDSLYLRRLIVVRYEDLVADPLRELGRVARSLGIKPSFGCIDGIDTSRSERYRIQWDRMIAVEPGLMAKYEWKAKRYGYGLDHPADVIGAFPVASSESA